MQTWLKKLFTLLANLVGAVFQRKAKIIESFNFTHQLFWRLSKMFFSQPARRFFFKKHNLGTCKQITELGKVSTERWTVPDQISKPTYYETLNKPSHTVGSIEIKSDEQISGMRKSCKLAANILKKCGDNLKVSIVIIKLNLYSNRIVIKHV